MTLLHGSPDWRGQPGGVRRGTSSFPARKVDDGEHTGDQAVRPDRDRQPRRDRRAAAGAPEMDVAARLRQCRALPPGVRGGRRASRRPAQLWPTCAKFPFTTKDDLRATYPFGMFAVPREQVVRIHASSGTTGKPTVVGYTRTDIDDLGGGDGPLDPRRRRPAGRHRPCHLWLRPVHRRPRRPLRRRTAGLHRGADVGRADRAAGPADPRFPARHHHGDAVLHAGDRRRVRAPGPRPAPLLAAHRHVRRRALDRRDAPRDRGALRHGRARPLRPVRGHGPGRRLRMRRDQGRPALSGKTTSIPR